MLNFLDPFTKKWLKPSETINRIDFDLYTKMIYKLRIVKCRHERRAFVAYRISAIAFECRLRHRPP